MNRRVIRKHKATANTAIVVIDQAWLTRAAQAHNLLQLLPPLQSLKRQVAKQAAGCGCNGKKSRANTSSCHFDTAKRQLANLLSSNPTALQQLRNILGAKEIHISYPKGDKQGMLLRKFI